ncbi:peptidoglycan-binding protein [Plectonema cf. radiosum LEGE 06105]|uniref:Peptidoglycan-binding protein n=1 Tax=Plectonema cf. radiosum LEGE 06105 TaxID=945769 RepID=A0A8J7F163_9CYAN|nr:peptidoglycan-binding domain-containing protein [Plectonema radiosum]MBE9211743.1 peptidoglycan-binding protein [Plectonema cf. radiosum LEGE 06105]
MKLKNITYLLSREQVKADKELIREIQIHLKSLGLYPGGKLIDGDYGPMTENAIRQFCQAVELPLLRFDENFAQRLLITKQLPFILETAKNREWVFRQLLTLGQKTRLSDDDIAAFLHRDIQNSTYINEIKEYAHRLAVKYETLANSGYSNYPQRGTVPTIENQGLAFLNSEITEACVCLGNFQNGQIQTRWLGKNALFKRQFWSATKIIPILNVACEANSKFAMLNIESCYFNHQNNQFLDIILDVISYRNKLASSNSAAAMLKLFQTPLGLEKWLKNITGNQQLDFRSGYGEPPFIIQSSLVDKLTGKQVLNAATTTLESDKNYISAYDLTRLISMLGWHLHINQSARLPGAQWHSLKGIIHAMGYDKARYAEVALETLGLEKTISAPVIISKLGYGYSSSRNTFEITYTAFIQFIDERLKSSSQLGKLRTFAMTIRGVTNPGNGKWAELDARMAADVTEIIRRVVTEEI